MKGKIFLPGDKSIAHRALILSAISSQKTRIYNLPNNDDCLATINCLKSLGIKIKSKKGYIEVFGKGLYGLKRPVKPISAKESGTTFRLLLGILSGQSFRSKLTADKSLSQRPMLRVTKPLRMMGAVITAKRKTKNSKLEEYAPVSVSGGNLLGIKYKMPVASAQVKSAILLAGLFAKGQTQVLEPNKSRDHTERMLKLFQAAVKTKNNLVSITGNKELVSPLKINIPGDVSSATFFAVAAAILKDSKVLLKNISLNPSRIGALRVLKGMGVDIKIKNEKLKTKNSEPAGDILVQSSKLKGIKVKRSEIPFLIDELPILMVAACFAEGKTTFEGVGELRVKETDRINSMTDNLKKMGAKIKILKVRNCEDIIIQGVKQLKGASLKSFGDHRTAMSLVIAGLAANKVNKIDDLNCIGKSFPGFLTTLKELGQ